MVTRLAFEVKQPSQGLHCSLLLPPKRGALWVFVSFHIVAGQSTGLIFGQGEARYCDKVPRMYTQHKPVLPAHVAFAKGLSSASSGPKYLARVPCIPVQLTN